MTLEQLITTKKSYNDVESLYYRGVVSQDTYEAYQEVWAFAGEWFQGRFVYYTVSDMAERLRGQITAQKQLLLLD